uniref:Reverse transcriptase domain-containing protein n=1 Tax=Tanacetum cinerariifolium TaxID=118510 RepID=A0A6L2KTB8_TANCI|nr:hypothetical protein [Tanacetum cinerariifolium]
MSSLTVTYTSVYSDSEPWRFQWPLSGDALPTALSPGYVAISNLEEDHEDDPTEDTKAFETDESAPTPTRSPRLRMARRSVRPQTPMAASVEPLIAEYAATPIPLSSPPSPLTPLSSPLPRIPSPPLTLPLPPTYTSLTYAKRACFITPTRRYEVGESSSAAATRQTRHTLAIGEHEVADACWACAHSESRSQAMEAQIRALHRDVDVLQRELVCTAKTGPQDGPVDAEMKANKTSRNGNDSHDSGTGSSRTERAAFECTYSDVLKCKSFNFKGNEGVVSLTQWFEKMESVFHISNCISAMKNIKEDDDRKIFPKRRDQEARVERAAEKQQAKKKRKSGDTSSVRGSTGGSTVGSQSESISEVLSQDYRRKCEAAEKAYEAKREKELGMLQCRELEFLMIDPSSLPPAKRAIIEMKHAKIMRKYPNVSPYIYDC